MQLEKQTNKILALAALIVIGLISASYFALTYRGVDASVSLESAPLPANPKPLHHDLRFRVAVAAMLSPTKSYRVYRELAERLAQEFGLPLELITRASYAEVNELLASGEVDVAFVCTGGYASDPDAMDVIAKPVIDGDSITYGLIIVPASSKARFFSDLRGSRFLFTDPDSNTGCWYPRMLLKEMGESEHSFFHEVQWTGSHDRSITAISQRMNDGAAVQSHVLAFMEDKDPTLSDRIRIIERSPPYPAPPVVVRKTMPFSQRKRLANVLFELTTTEHGIAILKGMGIDRFVPADNDEYRAIHPPEDDR